LVRLRGAWLPACRIKADAENAKSRNAILRLGAKEEGYFRKHMVYPDGRNLDSVYFSIIDEDWPSSKSFCSRGWDTAFDHRYWKVMTCREDRIAAIPPSCLTGVGLVLGVIA
jgi:hypothetical protein